MRQLSAVRLLASYDQRGRHVFTRRDFEKIFPDESAASLTASLRRLVASGMLVCAARGVYVYALSTNREVETLDEIAKALRPGEYNYVSLETALAIHSVISQYSKHLVTVMTTGREGEYHTPYGTVEFTHTKRPLDATLPRLPRSRHGSLRLADKHTAWRDLRQVGRNLHLVNMDVLNED